MKDSVLDICEPRNVEWGYQVDVRIRGEADLVKAEARYHKLCYDRFCKLPRASYTRRCVKPSYVDAALASCIDYMYASNQTTLGLAVKLHHKFGSLELAKLRNEHGIVTTYDEVM